MTVVLDLKNIGIGVLSLPRLISCWKPAWNGQADPIRPVLAMDSGSGEKTK
jgi:hypothetical protein